MARHCAIDLGGTKCAIGVYSSFDSREPFARQEFKVRQVDADTVTQEEMDEAFALDFDNLDRLLGEMAGESPDTISFIAAGPVNSDRTHLIGAGNLVHWQNRPAIQMLKLHYKCPAVLGNDAEGVAMAEALFGHAQGRKSLSKIWGTGVGGTLIVWHDGVPVFLPGELGHRRLGIDSGNSVPCGCGHTDCLESFCGGRSIERRDGDPKHIPRARWQYYGRIMAEATYDEVVQTRAELVTFSGGVACQQEWLLGEIQNYLLSEMHVVDVPEVKLSAFGESAGTLGALALGRQLLNK
jgi:predicted NBD/HSP70 family sugar kinase